MCVCVCVEREGGGVKWGQRPTARTTVCALHVSTESLCTGAHCPSAQRHLGATNVNTKLTGGPVDEEGLSSSGLGGAKPVRRRCPGVWEGQLYGSSAPATCP